MNLQRMIVGVCVLVATPAFAQESPGVFQQPLVTAQYAQQQNESSELMKKKDYPAAQKKCEQSIRMAPQYPGAHYNLACALARQGKKDEAFASLDRAIASGFNSVKYL